MELALVLERVCTSSNKRTHSFKGDEAQNVSIVKYGVLKVSILPRMFCLIYYHTRQGFLPYRCDRDI